MLLMASLSQGWGGDRYYLHTGSDDIHGIGEDGGSGCSQGPRDGLKDNVRALLRAQARQLLWNPGKDNASRYEVPPICPHDVCTTKTSPLPFWTFPPINSLFLLLPTSTRDAHYISLELFEVILVVFIYKGHTGLYGRDWVTAMGRKAVPCILPTFSKFFISRGLGQDKVSCSPGWPGTQYVAENENEP